MLDSVSVGERFTMWPLHMTILPWFSAPNIETVIAHTRDVVVNLKPFKVQVGQRAYFGQRKLPVKLIDNSHELQDLHERLLGMVNDNGWEIKGRYTGPNFRPHVTQKAGRDAGGELLINKIHIAEAQPQNYREIVGTIDL